jgi:hypothetical protein
LREDGRGYHLKIEPLLNLGRGNVPLAVKLLIMENVKSIAKFAEDRSMVSIAPKVRMNTNGYPFITFIDSDNKAENIYFSKAGAETVEEGQEITAELLKSLQVAEVENADGEMRLKLITNSERVSLASLLG